MFEFVAGIFALGLMAQIVFWIFAGVLFPLFWLWMLVDAAFRRPEDFSREGSNEKVLWVVLLLVLQIMCVPYFFMVYRNGRRVSYGAAGAPSV